MKNSFSLFLTALCLLGFNLASSQTIVSTTPENKNVVLEEFTGIYCTWCPDGHKIAQQIKDANPDDVILVNIHTGGYAAPSGSDPDFRTVWGSALASQSGLTGYPAGTINRRVFSGGATAMGRSSWASAANTVMAESSVVNVAGTCTLNVSTGEMTILVEVYYTGNSSASTNKLNVAILESNVKGPQTGGANLNPSNFDSEGNYLHQHMLRDFVTGQWGADVTPTSSGSFFTDTFSYTVPSSYNGIVPDYGQMDVAVYMAEGQQEILSGAYVPVTFVGITETNNAAIVSVADEDPICGTSVSPMVTIKNMGSANLVSLNITYDVNGGSSQLYTWTGNISSYKAETVSLPAIAFTPAGTNTINVTFTNPNGSTDEDVSNDQASSSFLDALETDVVLALELKTDDYGSETSWDLVDASGTILYSGGSYANNTTYNETFYLSEGCHTFSMYDSYGDGLGGGTPGYYKITDLSATVIASGVNFGSGEITPFESVCAASSTISMSTVESSCSSNDGSATCTVTGTSGPYTYLWSNGQTTSTATALSAGEYTVTITDASTCFTVETIIVNDAGAASVSSFSPQSACWNVADGFINLTVNGGTSPLTYLWSNGASSSNLTGLAVGPYTVTITDAVGCSALHSTEVTSADAIVVNSTVTNENVGNDGSIYLSTTGGTPAYVHSWTGPSGFTSTLEDIVGLAAGAYTVTITDGYGCILTQSYTVAAGQVGISAVDAPVEMLVYPNPFNESATVQFTLRKAEKVSIGIYNLVGQEILTVNEGTLGEGDHKITIDGGELVQGIYFVNVKVGETSYLKRIIHTK